MDMNGDLRKDLAIASMAISNDKLIIVAIAQGLLQNKRE